MPAADRETVLFLIRCHLELSARHADARRLRSRRPSAHGRQVETVERLKALTLLTYADISAVNPTAMTPWRAEQLWRLYLMVYNELTRELETDRIEAAPRGAARARRFLRAFPCATCAPTRAAEIDEHMDLERRSRARGAPWMSASWNRPGR